MTEKTVVRHNVVRLHRTDGDLAAFLDAMTREGWTLVSVTPRWLHGTPGTQSDVDEFLIVARMEETE